MCYAAAGNLFQLGYLPRTGPSSWKPVMEPADTNSVEGKVEVIKAAILTYGILIQQVRQLPPDFKPLYYTKPCCGEGTITWAGNHMEKRVPYGWLVQEGRPIEDLQHLYAGIKGKQHVVQALGKGPQIKDGVYSVDLEPVGTSWPFAFARVAHLSNAIRCVLLTHSTHPPFLRVCVCVCPCTLHLAQRMKGMLWSIVCCACVCPQQCGMRWLLLCRCILRGVQAIHSAKMGHGDLRWDNVIKVTDTDYVVIDLEMAVRLDSKQDQAKGNSECQGWLAYVLIAVSCCVATVQCLCTSQHSK